jgi:hypothetical protein
MSRPNNPPTVGPDPALWLDEEGNIRTMSGQIVGHV